MIAVRLDISQVGTQWRAEVHNNPRHPVQGHGPTREDALVALVEELVDRLAHREVDQGWGP